MIKKVIWSSMLDYPNEVSTVLFVGTCNWRCGYCQNLPLLNMDSLDFENDILNKMLKRRDLVNHIVLSGGECLNEERILEVIQRLKDYGFKVGIHTNGEKYAVLKNIIDYLDFVGLDIKTSKGKYDLITNSSVKYENIINSLKLILENNIQYDIRTTLYPKYVLIDDLIEIANTLKELNVKEYNLQKYKTIMENEVNYSNDDILFFKEQLDRIIKTNVRGLI